MCDYFLEDGDYFRLDNITLGWTPKLDTKWISNLRVYATVKNAFTITKRTIIYLNFFIINEIKINMKFEFQM